MKPFHFIIVCLMACASSLSFAQDSLITQIAKKHMFSFSVGNKSFTGPGWDTLISQIKASDFVLVGEDHFTNEIPFFCSAITKEVTFDNFFCEIDPYSAKIMESKIKSLDAKQLQAYTKKFGEVFSFFAFEPEFQLLKQLVSANTSIYGTDQIILIADRLICHELHQKTTNPKARTIYKTIEQQSKIHFTNYLKDQNKPFYLFTEAFENQINALLALDLEEEEKDIMEALKLTLDIYKTQSHQLRVQLMKNNLMKVYKEWENKKNLFKYGAFHLPKGESLWKIYDLGNLVNNVADSQFKKSLHIMVIGQSGTQASPFKGFTEQIVDETRNELKPLKPLFNTITSKEWQCFDMAPLRMALENGTVRIDDIKLERIVKGYDYVVIIPQVTAAKFLD